MSRHRRSIFSKRGPWRSASSFRDRFTVSIERCTPATCVCTLHGPHSSTNEEARRTEKERGERGREAAAAVGEVHENNGAETNNPWMARTHVSRSRSSCFTCRCQAATPYLCSSSTFSVCVFAASTCDRAVATADRHPRTSPRSVGGGAASRAESTAGSDGRPAASRASSVRKIADEACTAAGSGSSSRYAAGAKRPISSAISASTCPRSCDDNCAASARAREGAKRGDRWLGEDALVQRQLRW